jgi:hypothetical protein
LRKAPDNITRQFLGWNPQGTRKVGRLKQTWKRTVETEAKTAGWTWHRWRRDPKTGSDGGVWLQPFAPPEAARNNSSKVGITVVQRISFFLFGRNYSAK